MDSFEYTKGIRDCCGNVLTVKVNKVGGGTVGKFYRREDWDIKIYNSSDKLVWDSESKLHIGWTKREAVEKLRTIDETLYDVIVHLGL